MQESEALSELERLEVYQGRLLPGEYEVYFGYLVEGGSLVYSQDPLEIRVE